MKAACGTPSGYKRHLRAKQEPCVACRAAARDYRRELGARHRAGFVAKPAPIPECGTYAAAQRHGRLGEPVCDPCREANAAYAREWRARRDEEGNQLERDRNAARLKAAWALTRLHRDEFDRLYLDALKQGRSA